MNKALDFYKSNQNIKYTFPPIPKNCSKDNEITNWIFKNNIPFLNLDLDFDINEWQKESVAAEKFYVPHREMQNHKGWKSCCIHGISIEKTGIWRKYSEYEPNYSWTMLSNLTPSIKDFCLKLPFERFARIRFMKLDSGGWIEPHNDTPTDVPDNFSLLDHLIPINIAIDHPDDCFMSLKDFGTIPWKNGDVKIVNITNDHSVINLSNKNRTHLIIHGWIGNKLTEFNDLIARSYSKTVL